MLVRFIPCAKTKLAYEAPAKDLYVSRTFKRMRYYAELKGDPWYILSAKHGLVHPDMVLKPYDMTLNCVLPGERTAWGRLVRRQLPDMIPLSNKGDVLELLCGVAYRAPLMDFLPACFDTIRIPMKGMPLGIQYKWLGERIQELVNQRYGDAVKRRGL